MCALPFLMVLGLRVRQSNSDPRSALTTAALDEERAAIRTDLARLPSEGRKVIEFNRHRRVAASLPDAIAVLGAAGNQYPVQDLLVALLERVVVRDGQVSASNRDSPPGRSSGKCRSTRLRGGSRPRTDSNRRRQP